MNRNPVNDKARTFFMNNSVTMLFAILCLISYFASGTSLTFLLPELFTRMSRNTFLVLSLLIPVVAGMGLNFGIVIGAISAQIAVFWVVYWGFTGLPGLLLCVAICTPLAILFGWGVGALFNRMKGSEMIGGLVLGYFSDGLYQLLFLFIIGGVIPVANTTLIIAGGVGVKNTIDLMGNLKYSLDNMPMISILDFIFWAVLIINALLLVWRLAKKEDLQLKKLLAAVVPTAVVYALSFIPVISGFLSTDRLLLLNAIEIGVVGSIVYNIYKIVRSKMAEPQMDHPIRRIIYIACALVVYGCTYIPPLYAALIAVHLPVLTYLCIGGLCVLIPWFMNTRLGQNMRTVGQNRGVATSAGLNVDRIRIIAMIMSTVLASYGQLINLQNIGTFSTYGAHTQVGQFAIAALLVGGASVHRATTKQAVLGVILFHTLFILSPIAGKELFGNAQIGEYFRVFVAYGVIALALAMHAWRTLGNKKKVTAPATPPAPQAGAKAS